MRSWGAELCIKLGYQLYEGTAQMQISADYQEFKYGGALQFSDISSLK